MRKCLHFLYEESYGFFFGEVGRINDPEGLLQTCGFDGNFKLVQPLTTPQSDGVLQRQYPWKKHLLALVGGSHFASKDAKPHFFTLL